MPLCIGGSGFLVVTYRTFVFVCSRFGTSGHFDFIPITIRVTICGNFRYVCFITTSRTMMRFATNCCTSGCKISCPFGTVIVTESVSCSCFFVVTYRTFVFVRSRFDTSGCFNFIPITIRVTVCGNFRYICLVTTSRTMMRFTTNCCTRGCKVNCPFGTVIVTESVSYSCFLVVTYRTFVFVRSRLDTSGSFNFIPITIRVTVCGNFRYIYLVTTSRTMMRFATNCCTRGCKVNCPFGFIIVAKFTDVFLLPRKFYATYRAVNHAFITSIGCAIGFYTIFNNCFCICMTECIYCSLCYENFFATRAMLTFGQTCLCTSGDYSTIDYFYVTECIYCSLCYENFFTTRAMLTFGQTCLCTSGDYSTIDYFNVTECIYCSLCYENFATYRTALTFGKTGCSTSRSNCRIDNLGVLVFIFHSVVILNKRYDLGRSIISDKTLAWMKSIAVGIIHFHILVFAIKIHIQDRNIVMCRNIFDGISYIFKLIAGRIIRITALGRERSHVENKRIIII